MRSPRVEQLLKMSGVENVNVALVLGSVQVRVSRGVASCACTAAPEGRVTIASKASMSANMTSRRLRGFCWDRVCNMTLFPFFGMRNSEMTVNGKDGEKSCDLRCSPCDTDRLWSSLMIAQIAHYATHILCAWVHNIRTLPGNQWGANFVLAFPASPMPNYMQSKLMTL